MSPTHSKYNSCIITNWWHLQTWQHGPSYHLSCSSDHQHSQEPLITGIAEASSSATFLHERTHWHRLKEVTFYFHVLFKTKSSFSHCYFRELYPLNIKTLHTHIPTYTKPCITMLKAWLACVFTATIQAACIQSRLNAFWVCKQAPACHISVQVNFNLFL